MGVFCLASWKESPHGKVADLPPNTGYVFLAVPSYDSDFGLFECKFTDDDKSRLVEEVQFDVSQLLESAKDYPPALAVAREKVEKELEKQNSHEISRMQFLETYKLIFENLLREQKISNYFLCKAINTKSSYIYFSNEDQQVSWVSRDFEIYQNHISYFEVDSNEICELLKLEKQ